MSFKDMLLTISVALIWGLHFVVIKIALQDMPPFFLAALRFALVVFPAVLSNLSTQTALSLIYVSFFATIIGYGIWGGLLKRYETLRAAPFSLRVPAVGIVSASLLLGEVLSLTQMLGAGIVVAGLLINTFGGYKRTHK